MLLGWWLCDQIISFNSRDGVSVGLYLKQSHGFLAKNGLIIGHIWSSFFIFLVYVASFVLCITKDYFFLFSCDKYLY